MKIKLNDFPKKITYYTDGACSGNPGSGGCAAIELSEEWEVVNTIYKKSYILGDIFTEKSENTTNNREEMKAVIYVLKQAKRNSNHYYIIYSDSAYVVNMINDWIYKWQKNDWTRGKNKPVENLDLVKEIWDLIDRGFNNFELIKCGGHSGILGNEIADAVAANNKPKLEKLIKQNNVKRFYNFIDYHI